MTNDWNWIIEFCEKTFGSPTSPELVTKGAVLLREFAKKYHEEALASHRSTYEGELLEFVKGEKRTRENTIPSIANNPRFIETVEQQNIGYNAALQAVEEYLLSKSKEKR